MRTTRTCAVYPSWAGRWPHGSVQAPLARICPTRPAERWKRRGSGRWNCPKPATLRWSWTKTRSGGPPRRWVGPGSEIRRRRERMSAELSTLQARPALFERAGVAVIAVLVLLLLGLAGCGRRMVVAQAEQGD